MSKLSTSALFLFCTFQLIIGPQHLSGQTIDLNAKCEILEDLKIRDTHILSASVVTNDSDLPKYCRVTGYVLPAINFEIRLPTENWNGKFFMEGCGLFCGRLSFSRTLNIALKRGYAVSTMDAGHWGENVLDVRWAMDNRIAEIDWAYRAVHETAHVSKLVIEEFYAREPEISYFNGCSKAGQMAITEALRYPEDFDGIISGAPSIDFTGLFINHHWSMRMNIGANGKDIISPSDLELIIDAVYQACDSIDGLKDGLISDPGGCDFYPESLLCKTDENEGCLTVEQIQTLKAWYGGPKNSSGEQLYPGGIPLGSEPGWTRWIIGRTEDIDDNLVGQISLEFFRYMAFQDDPGENFNMTDFDFDTDPPRMEYMANIINSDNPDLGAFKARSGKLIMYHGWADAIITPWKSIEYYKEVEQRFGGKEKTQDFFRLFMIPGMNHCGVGNKLGITDSSIDPLTALEKWVEEGDAPESLVITKFDTDGNTMWERPVYPYSQDTE